ncbi:MAG TPA: hypothetical protein H9943_02025 [Candidatus Ruthenibacterium avium]|uniref:DivIVA domain-containing protein n=1 Tax=Candidatus Ruthenibacterium avium TaxID=2838751 RepID=A0A9D2M2I4_9FIRM|nr:hypothetical protein [Candidatus Ruthenibacterium avium]
MNDYSDSLKGPAVFHTQIWGFRREEVLEYIEKISAANAEKAKALGETIDKLRAELSHVKNDSVRLASAADHTCKELEAQKKKAETAVQESISLKRKMEQQKLSAAQVQQELEHLRFENDVLKKDNHALQKEIERLDSELNRRDSELREVNQTIQRVDGAMKRRMSRLKNAEQETQRQAQAVMQQAHQQADDVLRSAQYRAQEMEQQAREQAQARLEQAGRDAQRVEQQAYQQAAQAKRRLMTSVDEIAESIRLLKKQLEQVDEQVERASTGLNYVSAAPAPQQPAKDDPWLLSRSAHSSDHGVPHKPMAQPFAPFEQGKPHTPPYAKQGGDAVAFPPKPPEQSGQEALAYIPRPTPVAPGASFSQPYQPGQQTTAAPAMEQVRESAIQSLEDTPDIIPYLSPIPKAPIAAKQHTESAQPSPAKELLDTLHAMLDEVDE